MFLGDWKISKKKVTPLCPLSSGYSLAFLIIFTRKDQISICFIFLSHVFLSFITFEILFGFCLNVGTNPQLSREEL